jgi:hypothetical protein
VVVVVGADVRKLCLTCIVSYFNTCDYTRNGDDPPKKTIVLVRI